MFNGVFTALITPFKDNQIDEQSFRSFIDFQIKEVTSLAPVLFDL